VFPWELARLGPSGTFLAYGLLAVAALFFVLILSPETKGKSLEQIEMLFAGSREGPTPPRVASEERQTGTRQATT
jgi:hypothetical protein